MLSRHSSLDSPFDTNDSGESDTQLKWPADVAAGGGKYVIADTYNHRILIWNDIPQTNGSPPNLILTSAAHGDQPQPQPGLDRFAWPWGVWTDGNKLIVASTSSGSENGEIRFGGWVLILEFFPTSSGQPADIVLSANGKMGTPRSITTDGESFLLVGDHNADWPGATMGTWLWTSFPNASEVLPAGLITEDDFWGWQAGDITQDGDLIMIGRSINVWDGVPTSDQQSPAFSLIGFDWQFRGGDGSTVAVAGEKVYVSDYNLNRIIGFHQPPTSSTSKVPDFVIGAPDLYTNTLDENHFISNGLPVSHNGVLLIGDGLNTNCGNCWKPRPTESGQPPSNVLDIRDEVVALAAHKDTLVVAGSRDGLKVWDDGMPCDGQSPDREYRNH